MGRMNMMNQNNAMNINQQNKLEKNMQKVHGQTMPQTKSHIPKVNPKDQNQSANRKMNQQIVMKRMDSRDAPELKGPFREKLANFNHLPKQMRQQDPFWDNLSLDWSVDRLPKQLWEGHGISGKCRDYQYNPMIMD